MIFRQIIHDDLGCASYLVGDEGAGVVAVVDPKLDIDEYLALARYMGVEITHLLETHNHADHVSGHGPLAAATGATICISRIAAADYDHESIDDGWELELGSVLIRALHTPGHRPEHTAFVLLDRNRGPEPWAVLTGDSLFVGDVARADLAVEKREGARGIFRSLNEKLLRLPATCEVWPGHLGGSLCGGPSMDLKVSSTIGFEREHNPVLSITSEEEFVERTIAALGPQPPNFKNIVALNRGPLEISEVPVAELSPHQLAAKMKGGAVIVDVRTEIEFDHAHIPGALCNPLVRAGFGTKLAWLVDPGHEVVLVGRDFDDGVRAAKLANAVGIRNIGGCLTGGMTGWHAERRPTVAVERIDLESLHHRFVTTDGSPGSDDPAHGGEMVILDVRELSEWNAGHIPGSLHIPYHDLVDPPEWLVLDGPPIALVCSSGQRSAVAASLLMRRGAARVLHVDGAGVPEWERRGWPIERSAGS